MVIETAEPGNAMGESRSDRKRAAILEAAIAEFQTHGFQGTSMDGIARRADVSKRTVYNHFESKEALFETITAELWARAHGAVAIPYERDRPIEEQVRALAVAEVELVADPDFVKLARATLGEYFRSPDLARRAFERLSKEEDGISAWIRAAAADGRLTVSDVAVAGTQLKALLKAFVFWPQVMADLPVPSAEERAAIVDSAVAMFLDHYGAR